MDKKHIAIFMFLKNCSQFFLQNNIKHWIDFGTLLGAYRNGSFITHDYDVDVIVAAVSREAVLNYLYKQLKLIKILVSEGSIIQIELKYGVGLKRLDFYFFEERAHEVVLLIADGFKMPRFFTDELEWIKLYNVEFPCPRHLPYYLCLRYGNDFMTPKLTNNGTPWSVNMGNIITAKPYYRALTAGVFDHFHTGHFNLMKRIKENFGYCIAGVHSDEDVMTYKPRPYFKYEDRLRMVSSCQYVDEVIDKCPLHFNDDYLQARAIDYVVAGKEAADYINTMYGGITNLHLINRTEGISSSQIRKRLSSPFPPLFKKNKWIK